MDGTGLTTSAACNLRTCCLLDANLAMNIVAKAAATATAMDNVNWAMAEEIVVAEDVVQWPGVGRVAKIN